MNQIADICMICEGSYPYYLGGVSQWVHELIEAFPERTFHILTFMPPNPNLTLHYQFPSNVVGHTTWIVQDLPKGSPAWRTPKETWVFMHRMFQDLVRSNAFEEFGPVLDLFQKYRNRLGKKILLESLDAWDFMVEFYQELVPNVPFKPYFATMYTLTRSLYSILLPPLPKARLYHSVCTGYAGFCLYRAKKEEGAPCFLTEHGIYSNERRIEVAMAEWIAEARSLDLASEDKKISLRDFWMHAFQSFAHICYKTADEVITTFEGNQPVQREGGANPERMHVVAHGIDFKKYANVKKTRKPHPFTIAFIGRVVPIKDVKTFLRACQIVKKKAPEARVFVVGPSKEDPQYFEECKAFASLLGLENVFRGELKVVDFFSELDLLVLTSISEVQPLVMLEAGAVGIPAVATNVGACSQILYGTTHESPSLGAGGIITPLTDPQATANAILKLMEDPKLYQECSKAIANRIKTYYRADQEYAQYRKKYQKYLKG